MRAVDGKNLKVFAGSVRTSARNVVSLAVPRIGDGIFDLRQPRFAFGKFIEFAERNPPLIVGRLCRESSGREDAHHGRGQHDRCKAIQRNAELHKKSPSETSLSLTAASSGRGGVNCRGCGGMSPLAVAAADHATTSGFPGRSSEYQVTLFRQSGALKSGRPMMTTVGSPGATRLN